MLRRAVLLAALTLSWTFGLAGNPRADQEREDCGCSAFFYGYDDISSPPSFGPIYDGVTVTMYPGQCGGYCAGWAYYTAAGLCSYQSGTVAVSSTWGYWSPSGSGEDHFTVAYC
jgi:hypothetical protein